MVLGKRASERALLAKERSAEAEHPFGPEQALSCALQAQSRASVQGWVHEPVYSWALTCLPPVQSGPHQFPWIRTMRITLKN